MAITVETRTKIVELTVGMVGAAPGANILSELAEVVDKGLSLSNLAIAIANNPAFKVIYPSFLTNSEFANNFVNALMGSEATATNKTAAADTMIAQLNAGTHRGAAMYNSITALAATAATDANFGAAKTALANKTTVAVAYSVTTQQSSTSLDTLKAVVGSVTSAAASVTAALAVVDGSSNPGQTFALTTAIDNIAGTGGKDTFVADAATMSASDTIVGGLGIDTLNYTDASATGQTINANISGVEIINIRNINSSAVAAKAAVTETQVVTISGTATGQTAFLGVNVAASVNTDTATTTATRIVTDKANIIAGAAAIAAGVSDITSSGATVTLVFGNFAGVDVANIAASAVVNGVTYGAGVEVVKGVAAVAAVAGATDTVAAGSFVGATNFNSTNSTGVVAFTGLAAGQSVAKVGGTGAVSAAFGATVAPVVDLKGTTSTGDLTITGGTTAVTINSSEAATATGTNGVGVLTVPATVTALTVNATSNFSATSLVGMAANSAITATGAGSVSFGTTTAIPVNVATINAAGLTTLGFTGKLNNNAIVVTGGTGNDTFSLNASTLTTGSVNAGAGTDTLIMETADVATLAVGNKLSGFETVRVIAGSAQDLDFLATNNTIGTIQTQGAATLTNVTATTKYVALASGVLNLGIKGALTPGQIDTVAITTSSLVSTTPVALTLTAPVLAGVEILSITNTQLTTITSLASALALTNINATGGATTTLSITTTAIALQTNFAVNVSGHAGNFTFNGTGATTNGFSVTGGSGTNTITGGNQIFSANLAASTAKADVIAVTNATGGTAALANATITSFVSSADALIGDRVDVIGAAAVPVNVAAGTATTVVGVTGQLTTGILTFTGAALATMTLAQKLASATAAGFADAANDVVAFVHAGDTYIVSNQATDTTFDAGVDLVVKLVGVTDLTALSTTASGAGIAMVI